MPRKVKSASFITLRGKIESYQEFIRINPDDLGLPWPAFPGFPDSSLSPVHCDELTGLRESEETAPTQLPC